MLVVGLHSQHGQQLEPCSQAVAPVVGCRRPLHLARARHRGNVRLLDGDVVHVVFHEEGVVQPSAGQRLVVGQPDDMLRQHVVGRFKAGVHLVPAVVARTVQGIVQVQQVLIGKMVVNVGTSHGQRPFVVAQHTATPVELVARTLDVVAVPVVLAVGGVSGHGVVPCVRHRCRQVKTLQQQVLLLVGGRQAPGIGLTLGHAYDLGLHLRRLYLLVGLGIRQGKQQGVGPRLVGEARLQLSHQRLVGVVETATVGLDILP